MYNLSVGYEGGPHAWAAARRAGVWAGAWAGASERPGLNLCPSPPLSAVLTESSLFSSLDIFFRWLFDKNFLDDAKVRFQ